MSEPKLTNDFSPYGSHSAEKYQSNKPVAKPVTENAAAVSLLLLVVRSFIPAGILAVLTLVNAPKSSGSVGNIVLVPRVQSLSSGETSLLLQRLQELSNNGNEPF